MAGRLRLAARPVCRRSNHYRTVGPLRREELHGLLAKEFVLSKKWIREIRKIGVAWSNSAKPPKAVQQLWQELCDDYGDASIDDTSDDSLGWKSIVFKLLTIAMRLVGEWDFHQGPAPLRLFNIGSLPPTWLGNRSGWNIGMCLSSVVMSFLTCLIASAFVSRQRLHVCSQRPARRSLVARCGR
jgi:hypothetical protein